MADYLATNTPRLRMTQSGPRGTHKMGFRVVPGTTAADALAAATPIIEAMLLYMLGGSAWTAAEFAPEGSDVFLPVDFTPIAASTGDRPATNQTPYGVYMNFIARSAGGSRCAWYLFNVPVEVISANNRSTLGEYGVISAVISAFQANSLPLCGIDQTAFTMKQYANTGINDKVARKSRSLV